MSDLVFDPYAPLNTLKPIAEQLWLVDGPEIRMSFPMGLKMPFPTRMTVVRLQGGGLWIHSPTQLTDSLRAQLAELGPVEHLISPNFIHYASIPSWSQAYPQAKTWASPGVRERAAEHNIEIEFDADLGDGPPAEWAEELDQLIFGGSKVMREVVFFHRSSKTVILTDLIENFEAERTAQPWRSMLKLAGAAHPDGKAPIDMRMTFMGGHDQARVSLDRMLAWAPERVILAHGRWYERDGLSELKRAFRWVRG